MNRDVASLAEATDHCVIGNGDYIYVTGTESSVLLFECAHLFDSPEIPSNLFGTALDATTRSTDPSWRRIHKHLAHHYTFG